MTLDQVVDVDYYIPGCPPPPELVPNSFGPLLMKGFPKKGFVFGDRKALCHMAVPAWKQPERNTGERI
jgi:F420-non-reducing hydrogenase small subunit